MDKLTQIRTLVRVAERASFSAVARELAVTQSAVSKAITALEQSLGARLVNRNSRRVALTEAGRRYYESCRQILAELDAADAAVGDSGGPLGTLRVAAPVPFGLMFVTPRALRFQGLHPGLAIDLDLNDQPLDLIEHNLDVAIRLGHLQTPGLVARKLGDSPFVAVAAPVYLAAAGLPATPAELRGHQCLIYTRQANAQEWSFADRAGSRAVSVGGALRSNNLLVLKDAAVAGLGIARLPLWMVDAELKAGLLQPVLGELRLPSFAIHAVFPSARQIPSKVRLFVDFMQAELGAIGYFCGRPASPAV